MIGAFLVPLVSNANGFMQSGLRLASGTPPRVQYADEFLPDGTRLVYTAVAVLILALMLAYHARLLQEDRRAPGAVTLTAPIHRLFIYVFSASGLLMSSIAAATVLQWLFQTGDEKGDLIASRYLVSGIAGLVVALPLWLYFWYRAQHLYRHGGTEEQSSLLRKFYLYLVIFLAVYATVAALTAVLASIFRQFLGLEARSGSGLVISALVVGLVVWVYHALVLREDTRQVPMPQEQAGLRRLYRYLVAGVALLVLLIGLGGLLGVLFDPSPYIVDQQRENLAWFTAMVIAGLAVWIIPWRSILEETAEPPPQGSLARGSIVRRFYLFFFLLLATLTFLITAVFILSRMLLAILGEPQIGGDLRTLALAAAYAIMAAAVWLYHGWLLRGDRDALEEAQERRAALKDIVVFGDDRLAWDLLDSLREEFPQSTIAQTGPTDEKPAETLKAADIIVGPWTMAAAGGELGAAIAASPARKLILPSPAPGWQWAGVDKWDAETAVRQAVEEIESIIAGETAVKPYTLTPGVIILLIAATILILILLTSLLGSVLPIFG
jgi:hypothetical protein